MTTQRVAILAAALLMGCGFESADRSQPPPNADRQGGCAIECHGDDTSNAPPKSMSGATETTSVAVGAHRVHLTVEPDWHQPVQCQDCHVVPEERDAPGHIDGDGKAEVTFAMAAGPNAAWDGTTCTTACHGSAAFGGAQPLPTWTRVDGTQSTCGSCHGRPPPPPHTTQTRCATCHPTMEEDSITFRDPASHINGSVEVADPAATGGCTTCHGSETSSAPPKDLSGDTLTTAQGVGAHAAHLRTSTWRNAIRCASCHVVPLTADAPGHRDDVDNTAEVKFATLNPQATYSTATAGCSKLYCHGTGRDNNGSATWTVAGPLTCSSCHGVTGTGMSGAHQAHITANVQCSLCHQLVIDQNRNIINPALHVNGAHDVKLQSGTYDPSDGKCQQTACHGARVWGG